MDARIGIMFGDRRGLFGSNLAVGGPMCCSPFCPNTYGGDAA